jgi:hypothetical protein
MQLIGNKEYQQRGCETDFDWTEIFEQRQVEMVSQLVSTLAAFLRLRGLIR